VICVRRGSGSAPAKPSFFNLRGPSERYHHQGFRSAGQSHNYRAWAWPLTVEPGGLGRSMPLHSGERDVLVNFRGARHTHTVPSQPVESAPRIPNTTPPGRLALATRTPHRCVWSPNSSLTSKNLNAVGHRDADCCPVAFSQGPLPNGLHLLTARPVPAPAYSISKKKLHLHPCGGASRSHTRGIIQKLADLRRLDLQIRRNQSLPSPPQCSRRMTHDRPRPRETPIHSRPILKITKWPHVARLFSLLISPRPRTALQSHSLTGRSSSCLASFQGQQGKGHIRFLPPFACRSFRSIPRFGFSCLHLRSDDLL
jgi:hypothetical protein